MAWRDLADEVEGRMDYLLALAYELDWDDEHKKASARRFREELEDLARRMREVEGNTRHHHIGTIVALSSFWNYFPELAGKPGDEALKALIAAAPEFPVALFTQWEKERTAEDEELFKVGWEIMNGQTRSVVWNRRIDRTEMSKIHIYAPSIGVLCGQGQGEFTEVKDEPTCGRCISRLNSLRRRIGFSS